jgi:hypothetical protein
MEIRLVLYISRVQLFVYFYAGTVVHLPSLQAWIDPSSWLPYQTRARKLRQCAITP